MIIRNPFERELDTSEFSPLNPGYRDDPGVEFPHPSDRFEATAETLVLHKSTVRVVGHETIAIFDGSDPDLVYDTLFEE